MMTQAFSSSSRRVSRWLIIHAPSSIGDLWMRAKLYLHTSWQVCDNLRCSKLTKTHFFFWNKKISIFQSENELFVSPWLVDCQQLWRLENWNIYKKNHHCRHFVLNIFPLQPPQVFYFRVFLLTFLILWLYNVLMLFLFDHKFTLNDASQPLGDI